MKSCQRNKMFQRTASLFSLEPFMRPVNPHVHREGSSRSNGCSNWALALLHTCYKGFYSWLYFRRNWYISQIITRQFWQQQPTWHQAGWIWVLDFWSEDLPGSRTGRAERLRVLFQRHLSRKPNLNISTAFLKGLLLNWKGELKILGNLHYSSSKEA